MSERQIKRLAAEIVADLFCNGAGQEAKWLVLILPDGRDGGGWCREAATARVEGIIRMSTSSETGRMLPPLTQSS